MSGLRLGPIVEEKPVKIMIEISGALHTQLAEYARIHAEQTGGGAPLAPEKLVPPMIERFIAADRGFARLRKR